MQTELAFLQKGRKTPLFCQLYHIHIGFARIKTLTELESIKKTGRKNKSTPCFLTHSHILLYKKEEKPALLCNLHKDFQFS